MRRSLLVTLGWILAPLVTTAAPADLAPPPADLARRAEAIARGTRPGGRARRS